LVGSLEGERVCVMCVGACVCERERERQREIVRQREGEREREKRKREGKKDITRGTKEILSTV
jgi:hypothetical protein